VPATGPVVEPLPLQAAKRLQRDAVVTAAVAATPWRDAAVHIKRVIDAYGPQYRPNQVPAAKEATGASLFHLFQVKS
jgi:hypothetical protein